MSEVKIPQALLNVIADVNIGEINSHIYTNESMLNWLCAWHEEVKRELYNFANNHELYEQGRADAINKIHTDLITEIAMLNATDMTDVDLYAFAVRIKEITDKLISK